MREETTMEILRNVCVVNSPTYCELIPHGDSERGLGLVGCRLLWWRTEARATLAEIFFTRVGNGMALRSA